MLNRIIKSKARGSSFQLISSLSSLLVLEMLNPGKELYLLSPWLSEVPIINNHFGQFRDLTRDMNKNELSLADVFQLLARKGTKVRIMCRPGEAKTDRFLAQLASQENIEYRKTNTLHEKGLITSHFYLRGSMNFTYAGINLNDESIEISRDHSQIINALQEARIFWERVELDVTNSLYTKRTI